MRGQCERSTDKRHSQLLHKRAQRWKSLSHPNVSPLVGVSLTPFQLSLAYDLRPGGNIKEHAVSHPNVPRLSLVRKIPVTITNTPIHKLSIPHSRQLLDLAEGLKHLHDLDVIHGNITTVGCPPSPSGCISSAASAAWGNILRQCLRDCTHRTVIGECPC